MQPKACYFPRDSSALWIGPCASKLKRVILQQRWYELQKQVAMRYAEGVAAAGEYAHA